MRKLTLILALALILAACGGTDETETAADTADAMSEESMDDEMMSDERQPTTFTVTITNTSGGGQLETPLAPGAFVVHTAMETLFADGSPDRGEGLKALAEDGDPNALISTLGELATVSSTGAFANPDGASDSGPALPGSSFTFTFEAAPGDYLSFATMFVQSNDWFFTPSSSGINLFEGGEAIEGDVTAQIGLWDAGTEVDETPGEGPNQAPRQAGPDTGEDQDGNIAMVTGYEGTISVTITTG